MRSPSSGLAETIYLCVVVTISDARVSAGFSLTHSGNVIVTGTFVVTSNAISLPLASTVNICWDIRIAGSDPNWRTLTVSVNASAVTLITASLVSFPSYPDTFTVNVLPLTATEHQSLSDRAVQLSASVTIAMSRVPASLLKSIADCATSRVVDVTVFSSSAEQAYSSKGTIAAKIIEIRCFFMLLG